MRSASPILVVVAVFSVVVNVLDVVGWWSWNRVVRSIAIDSEGAATRVADDPLLAVPAAVQRSRRLSSGALAGASTATLVAALERISSLQKTWFRNYPDGFRHGSRAALLVNDVDAGLEQLSLALARDPTSAFLHRWAAILMRASGRHRQCLEHLADAQAIAPMDGGPMFEVTEDDARWLRLEALRRRLDRYPRQRPATAVELARELRRAGEIGEARAMLVALSGQPTVAIELARWDIEGGAPLSAARRLEAITARTAYPASLRGAAWAMLAEARDLLGDPEAAAAAARQALSLDPHSTAPYLALATIAERRGDDLAALEHLRTAWGVTPTDVGLLVRVAGVAERVGRLADARRALERSVEVEPSSPELLAQLVAFHLRHGQYMEAALRLSSSLDRFPTDEGLLELAARLRSEVGGVGR